MNAGHRVVHDVSVVIPTVGRTLLQGCLRSIADGSAWPDEVIVVDQGSSSAVSAWVHELQRRGVAAVHLPSRQTGIAAATNRGLERVRTAIVAVTHDDCRVHSGWLESLAVQAHQAGDAVVTGRVEPGGDGIVPTVMTSTQPAVYREPLLDGDVLFPPNMAFPIRLLERVGLFDEHPTLSVAGEDNEWAYRVLRAGIPIVYAPEPAVTHLATQHSANLAALYRRYARGQGSFYGKYMRRGDSFIARRAARDLARGPWRLLRGFAERNPNLIAMGRGETSGMLPGIIAGLRRDPHA